MPDEYLGATGLRKLVPALHEMTQLTSLKLEARWVRYGNIHWPTMVHELVPALCEMKQLTSLNLASKLMVMITVCVMERAASE